jgi:8-hydroxy-5-deazaflavin:NADPH oxidoreductase
VDAGLIVPALPSSSLETTLPPLARAFEDKVVISAVNPLAFDERGPYTQTVAEGSAAERSAKLLPGARLVGAFHPVSAASLLRLDQPMDDDVPVVGDDSDAVDQAASLARRMDGVRAFSAGARRLASSLEPLTPVLISINRHHRSLVGLRLSRLHV